MTDQEIVTLRDLNYIARRDYKPGAEVTARLLALSQSLLVGTYRTFVDVDAGYLLGMMAGTKDGSWGPHHEMIGRLAAEMGVTVKPVPAPSPVVVAPPPPDPVAVQPSPVPGELKAQLEAMGFCFAKESGTLEGFKLVTDGAPEGKYYGYVGVIDGALRLFAGIREKIGQAWPNVDRNPNLPIIMGPVVERDGAISWDFEPPLTAAEPNPHPFKTFLIYLGGFRRGVGPRGKVAGKYIDFGTFEAGRGKRWFSKRTGSATPDIDVSHGYDADNPNPFFLKVDGQLRRVVVGSDGVLRAGEVVDENQ